LALGVFFEQLLTLQRPQHYQQTKCFPELLQSPVPPFEAKFCCTNSMWVTY
jgi:hypothetical protein